MTAVSYTHQITWPWNRPYHEQGLGLTSPTGAIDSGFFPVAVDGREYIVDFTSGLYRRFSVDVLRTRQNRQPDENLLLEPEVWRVAVESWSQGGGQTRRDRDTSLPHRFFASKNIDVWDKWRITLLPTTEKVQNLSGDAKVVSTALGLVVVDGTSLTIYRDSLDFTPYTEVLPSEPTAITADGQSAYLGFADGTVVKYLLDPNFSSYQSVLDNQASYTTVAGLASYATLLNDVDPVVPQAFGTAPGQVDLLAYVKGFIVAAVGPTLYDMTLGTADDTTKINTFRLSSHRWVAATDGLSAGYLLGGQGDRWHVYWITVRDDASTLNPPVVAAPLPEGEVGYSLGSYLGFVLIGTDQGVRFSTPGGDNSLTFGQLVSTGSPVMGFEGQDRFVWFGVGGVPRNAKEPLHQPEAGLARMDLSTFTSPLTPAYASDIVVAGDLPGRATQVTTFNGKRVFAAPGLGLYQESDTLADEGWLEDGVMTLGAYDAKTALYAAFMCEPSLGEIALDLAYDSRDYEKEFVLTGSSSVTSGNIYLENRRFNAVLPRYRLVKGSDGQSPVMTRFEIRAAPIVGNAHEWQVPLLLAERINYDNAVTSRDLPEDFEHLVRVVESGRVFQFREGNKVHLAFSPGYEWRPESQSDDDDTFRGLFILRVREIR